MSEEGTSGSYILNNIDGSVAVFKPIDEEAFAPNNPRGMKGLFGSETSRPGIKSGEATIREIAAYLLDHGGFSGVPATTLVSIKHECFSSPAINDTNFVSQDDIDLMFGLIQI